MNVEDILKKCSQKGIILKTSNDRRLEYYGPREAVTPEMLTLLKKNKISLIQALTVIEVFDGHIVIEGTQSIH